MYRRLILKITAILLVVIFSTQSSVTMLSARTEDNGFIIASELNISLDAFNAWTMDTPDLGSCPEIWVAQVLAMQEHSLAVFEEILLHADVVYNHHDIGDRSRFGDNYQIDLMYSIFADSINVIPYEQQQEIASIEWMAEEIFQFYQRYGFFPDEEEFMASVLLGARAAIPIDPSTAVTIFQQLGFFVTQFAVSTAAARIGSIIGLGAAIPVVQVVALVTGAAIISGGIVIVMAIAAANAHAISWEINRMLNSNMWDPEIANRAVVQAQMIVAATQSGFRHFAATRFNGPGGGIVINFPIDHHTAVWAISQPQPAFLDIFSPWIWDAFNVVANAFPGTTPILDRPHNPFMPLNFPHWHPIDRRTFISHSFFYFM